MYGDSSPDIITGREAEKLRDEMRRNGTPDAHPAAEVFPLMKGTELQNLAADIEANGLREPIVRYEGRILDGRNRLRPCEMAEVDPEFTDPEIRDPYLYVFSANANRRHLTKPDKFGALHKLPRDWIESLRDEARKRQKAGTSASNGAKVSKRLGQLVGLSARDVERFRQLEREDPDLAEKVVKGKLSVSRAVKKLEDEDEEEEDDLDDDAADLLRVVEALLESPADSDRENHLLTATLRGLHELFGSRYGVHRKLWELIDEIGTDPGLDWRDAPHHQQEE